MLALSNARCLPTWRACVCVDVCADVSTRVQAVKQRTKDLDAGAAHLRSKLSGHLGPDFEQVGTLEGGGEEGKGREEKGKNA